MDKLKGFSMFPREIWKDFYEAYDNPSEATGSVSDNENEKECECGKDKHGFETHSKWCPKES